MYDSPIWFSNYDVHMDELKSVQRIFLRKISSKLGCCMQYDQCDYTLVSSRANIHTLKSVCDANDSLLAYKIVKRIIDCDSLSTLFRNRTLNYNLRRVAPLQNINAMESLVNFKSKIIKKVSEALY